MLIVYEIQEIVIEKEYLENQEIHFFSKIQYDISSILVAKKNVCFKNELR